MFEVYLVLLATALATSILGPFLVLRNMAMTSDALAHSALLGIVCAFLLVYDLNSPYLFLGAALFGLLSLYLVEFLSEKNLVKKDDALGIVFPIFFSLAVILISKVLRNLNIDIDLVLNGEVLLTPFIRFFFMPKALFFMLCMFFINLLFVKIFFRPLRLVTFDEEYAKLQKVRTKSLFYALISLVALTSVLAFESVGSILVISFFIAPAASAYLFATSLQDMLIKSMLFGFLNVSIGFPIALYLNVSIAGTCSFVGLCTVIVTVCLHKHGFIAKYLAKKRMKEVITSDLILLHLFRHAKDKKEVGYLEIAEHLAWKHQKITKKLNQLIAQKLAQKNDALELYELTKKGKEKVLALLNAK